MEQATGDYRPIEDYGIIGDCGSAALISRTGSIDWLCWPQFDSPSVFGALLDKDRGGRFRIAPSGRFKVRRKYIDRTNVLETTFETGTGVARLTDLMPVDDFDAYDAELWPDHSLIRRIECLSGHVDVEILIEPRLDYARVRADIEDRGEMGFFFSLGPRVFLLRSELPLDLSSDHATLSRGCRLHEGERYTISMSVDEYEPAVLPPLGVLAEQQIERTIRYWQTWADGCNYEGPFEEHMLRGAMTLKLMTYSRSGAVVASPTTSLPEKIGGVRNWDYRYCWLRDAGMCLRALMELGYTAEADAYFAWVLHTTRQSIHNLHIMYDVYGKRDIPERVLDHLDGYRGSKPVRIGNAAVGQLQLDTYAEVAVAGFEYVKEGGTLDRWQRGMLRKTGEAIIDRWHEPDEGIWEIRAEPRQHTYSKLMCWAALDRLARLHDHGDIIIPKERFQREANRIREVVLTEGYNRDLGAFVSVLGGDKMDASLLLMAEFGFLDPNDPRMIRTHELILEKLGDGVLLRRYEPHADDGLPGEEGAFGICSFWDDEYLARRGLAEEAVHRFETMLGYANDLGLYAEQLDPETGAHLGNFPQAFTHIGLINTLLVIAHETGERPAPEVKDKFTSESEENGRIA